MTCTTYVIFGYYLLTDSDKVTGRASSPQKNCGTNAKTFFRNKWRYKAKGEPANQCSPERWLLKWSMWFRNVAALVSRDAPTRHWPRPIIGA